MKMKKKKRAFGAVIMLLMMLLNLFGGRYSLDVKADNPPKTWAFQKNGVQTGNAEIKIRETAVESTYNNGIFDVVLEVEGGLKPVEDNEKLDVVLLIDRSGSMQQRTENDQDDLMGEARKAATDFVDKLLTDNSGNPRTDGKVRVGLVSFGGVNETSTAPVLTSFALSNDPTALKEEIEQYTSYPATEKSGGTFTQAGLMEADRLLGNSSSTNDHTKVIILITNGKPTYAYNDTNGIIGNGADEELDRIKQATLNEAQKIKGDADQRVYIYSVGIGVSAQEKEGVKEISTQNDFTNPDPKYFFEASKTEGSLKTELGEIANKLILAVLNGELHLTMNEMVKFKTLEDPSTLKVEVKNKTNQSVLQAKSDEIKSNIEWKPTDKKLEFKGITLEKMKCLKSLIRRNLWMLIRTELGKP